MTFSTGTISWVLIPLVPVALGVDEDNEDEDYEPVTDIWRSLVPDLGRTASCPSQDCSPVLVATDWDAGVTSRWKEVEATCKNPGMSVLTMIIHLNDECQWTREQIADWLDTLDFDLSIHPQAPEVPESTERINA